MPAVKNAKHEAFARNVGIKGMSAAEAYRTGWKTASKATAETEGPALARKPQIALRISEIREKAAIRAAEKDFLTVEEKRRFCARTLRLNPEKLDVEEDGDLVQGIKYDKHGRKIYELMSAKDAIALDNDLAVDGAEAGANKAMEIIIRKL